MLSIHPPVIGHRGASYYAPENTIAAFVKAKQLGINWVEFDVMLTACGEVVVIHDHTLERTTNVKGNVSDFTYEELKKLDAGSWFHPQFHQEKIPCLQDVLALLKQQRLSANIEIKAQIGKEDIIVKKVLDFIANENSHILLSSFSLEVMRAIRKVSDKIQIGLLIDTWFPGWEKISDELNCVSIHLNQKLLDKENIARMKAMGKQVLAYTVNDVKRAKELFSLGVDAIFSDLSEDILTQVV